MRQSPMQRSKQLKCLALNITVITSQLNLSSTTLKFHDDLMFQLHDLQTEAEIMDWLYQYIPLIDHIHINDERGIVRKFLESKGYRESDCLGEDKEFYKNKSNLARYVIGQILNCWHPVAQKFIEDYRKLG